MATENEIDGWIAEYVLGHQIIRQRKGGVKEKTKAGHVRPLRRYSKDLGAAWEVVEHLSMTLIPIQGGSWFVMVGKERGWESPAELFQYLQTGDFVQGGAALVDNAPMSICIAALRAVGKKEGLVFEGLAPQAEQQQMSEATSSMSH